MTQQKISFFLLIFFVSLGFAQVENKAPLEVPAEPIWEYGVGVGFVRFEQYPASGKYSEVFLPFPTFQYRGRRVRADDREGAKAYLWKEGSLSVEMSGTGSPYFDSDDNEYRRGMKDIPWIFAVGPQVVYKIQPNFDLAFGTYQATATDFRDTRLSGAFFEGKLTYSVDSILANKIKSLTRLFLTFKSASQEVQNLYFGVKAQEAAAERQQFKARAGYLSTEISIYQSYKLGRMAFYFGGNYADYSMAKNKRSPLYKSNFQMNYLFGVTYALGESTRPEVSEEETSGIIK